MTALDSLLYAVRWLSYLMRRLLYAAYVALHFLSKPGSRLIVPALLLLAGAMVRPALHDAVIVWWRHYDPRIELETWFLDGILLIAAILPIIAYVVVSRVLALLIGTFRPVTRPLPPLRHLRPTTTVIRPAVVRLAVPSLPRRRA